NVINTIDGCKTGEKSASILRMIEAPPQYSARVLRVAFSSDPLDCAAVCKTGDVAFCQGAVPEGNRGSQLSQFEQRVRKTTSGTIPMRDVHRIFKIADADDPCKRGGLKVSMSGIESTGPSECLINASVALGAKDIEMTIHIPKKLRGRFSQRTLTALSVSFDNPGESGILEISDPTLNSQWGGQVQAISVVDDVAYFGMKAACLKVPLK
ncbi:hypothetical protein ABIF50_003358, partial [Bradyrhizobium diazoefficiens]